MTVMKPLLKPKRTALGLFWRASPLGEPGNFYPPLSQAPSFPWTESPRAGTPPAAPSPLAADLALPRALSQAAER